jgi:hypothetical protein
MAFSRNTFLLLPCAAILLQPVAAEDVEAAQCLSSAAAVRQEYPGAWPSWTMHAANHKGEKCWFPASREARSRPINGVPEHTAARPRHHESRTASSAPDGGLPASLDDMDLLGWSLRTRTALATTAVEEDYAPVSTFNERFAAAFERNTPGDSPIIQRMVNPILIIQ